MLVLIQHGKSCPKIVKVTDGRRVFHIVVEEDRPLASTPWIENHLDLKEVTEKSKSVLKNQRQSECQVAVKGVSDHPVFGNNFKSKNKVGEKGMWHHLDRNKVADGFSGEGVKHSLFQHKIWINKKEKGKLVVSRSPKSKPLYALVSNAKHIIGKHKAVNEADGVMEEVSSSSSDSEEGTLGAPKAALLRKGLGLISLSGGSSSEDGPQGDVNVEIGPESNELELIIDLRGGPKLIGGIDKRKDSLGQNGRPDNREVLLILSMMNLAGLIRGRTLWDREAHHDKIPNQADGRDIKNRGRGSGSHGMRTRSAILRESHETNLHDKLVEETREGFHKVQSVTETELYDVNGNGVFWNLEEEVSRFIETSVAIGKTTDGKAKELLPET
ncbi:hypothetical protein QYF36_003673 [Acer negundo]|nr:hypothetical protein QYF36_003673 [Acer negundo]